MFQFRAFPAYSYLIQSTLTRYCRAGFPHSEISGSMRMCRSPKLIAACHVLHRLLMPRHSPCALISLTIFWFSERIMQFHRRNYIARIVVFTLNSTISLSQLSLHPLLPCNFSSSFSSLFSFQGADPVSIETRYQRSNALSVDIHFQLVEISGIEPLTPCLQSRCSPS